MADPTQKPADADPKKAPGYQAPGSNIRYVGKTPVVFNAGIPMTSRAKDYSKAKSNSLYRKNRHNAPGMIVRDFNMNSRLTDAGGGWGGTKTPWGFQFHYNPTNFAEAYVPPTDIDYIGFMQDIANSSVFTLPTSTGASIQFDILLNRREDMAILRRDNWRDFYEASERPTTKDREDILAKGTQYDLEYFFRVVNLDPIDSWNGESTSDWGLLMGMPVIVSMGDSEGCRKFRGQVMNLSVTHMQYAPGMIPVYTKVAFSIARWPDMFGDSVEITSDSTGGTGDAGSEPGGGSSPTGNLKGLTAEQSRWARFIYARSMNDLKVGTRATQAALMTAMVESSLRNLDHGDADSVGLFQQRPSQGWGTKAQCMDASYSVKAFFGIDTRNPGLLDIDGWKTMPLGEACQEVQRSAYPDRYAAWEDEAAGWIKEMTIVPSRLPGTGTSSQCPATKFDERVQSDTLKLMRCVYANFNQISTIGTIRAGTGEHSKGLAADFMLRDYRKDSVREYGWSIARWCRNNAKQFGIQYVIFADKIWNIERNSEGWRDYTHPSGSRTDTDRHLDHVHVTTYGNKAE